MIMMYMNDMSLPQMMLGTDLGTSKGSRVLGPPMLKSFSDRCDTYFKIHIFQNCLIAIQIRVFGGIEMQSTPVEGASV